MAANIERAAGSASHAEHNYYERSRWRVGLLRDLGSAAHE
jgi:hypothetical protein